MPSTKTLDLSDVASASASELHEALATAFKFPAHHGGSWDAFWDCITEQQRLPDVLILDGLDELENRLPREAARLLAALGDYNNEQGDHICAAEVSDSYAGPLHFVSIEAKPGPNAETTAIGGFINCWIKTADPKEAERIARDEVEEAGWLTVEVQDVIDDDLDYYRLYDTKRQYAKQACIDSLVVVFHTYDQKEAPDEDDYDSCEERRAKTVELLQAMGVAVNEYLPHTEPESEIELRTATETAQRILCLLAVSGAAHEVDRTMIRQWLMRENLWEACSLEETAFLESPELDKDQAVQLSWRQEALWLLAWAIGTVDELAPPTAQSDIDEILRLIPCFEDSTQKFVESATMRPVGEIMAMSDFLYCAHWAARNQDDDPETAVGDLDRSVVMERHYAINWLTRYGDADWDDVTCDT